MPIDWFTICAQAINFLILVWLLKRFLYKPILQAIDAREKGIALQLSQAEAKRAEAEKDRASFVHKNEDFDKERASLWQKATTEAQGERQRLLDVARKDADAVTAKRHDALEMEQRNLYQDIMRWTQNEVFAISHKALADLASTSLEERMAEILDQRLRTMSGAAKEQMGTALNTEPRTVQIRSAFDLQSTQRASIESAVKDTFHIDPQFQYVIAPDVISGIELSSNGQKVAWSIADYLATLQRTAGEMLKQDAQPKRSSPEASRPKAPDESKSGSAPASNHQPATVVSAPTVGH